MAKRTQKIINKVPHAVYILDDNGQVIKVFPKSNGMIRVEENTKQVGMIGNVPITVTTWEESVKVPDPVEGTYYIVSNMVQNALPDRRDLLAPRGVVRDAEGNIIGVKSLDFGPIPSDEFINP